jgi:hypothetical protein
VRFRVCSLSRPASDSLMFNLGPGGVLRWKVEDHQLRRSGNNMWQAGTSKVVAPTCVG